MEIRQYTSKTHNITLWIAQIILFLLFISGAVTKLFFPAEKLAAMWPWTAVNGNLVILTGILDALAAFGLILPMMTGIAPKLTFFAALGAAGLMMGAIVFHIGRGEAEHIGINVFTLLVALFIAWNRKSVKSPSS
ncbi:DoxX family protein [Pedobacter sp. BAL39]|uniref:DoxX family protein n=1 Tax=Pedobacter sp. BAL39 TaxID=391596 RepID=UPI00058734C6|nr:DoxX family protein [Pedobacter sp. BAL39]